MILIVKKSGNDIDGYGPDYSQINQELWFVKSSISQDGGETYTLELEWIGQVPFQITNAQGQLQLVRMGLYNQVLQIIEALGEQERIYFHKWPHWERTSPLLARITGYLGWNDEQVDQFFEEASKLR